MTFEQRLFHGNAWKKAVSGEGSNAKVLRQDHSWCVGGTARKSVWLECHKTGVHGGFKVVWPNHIGFISHSKDFVFSFVGTGSDCQGLRRRTYDF